MAVINTRMKGWVRLPSDAAYSTLKTTGTYTYEGTTFTYDDCTVYLTPDTGIGGTGLDGNKAVITNSSGDLINSGVSAQEVGYLINARKNIQEQIDDLYNKIGTAGAGVYVLNNMEELLASTDTPGTYYVPDAYGTYYEYVIDDAGKIQLIGTGVPPEDIGKQDLSAYQKKADTNLQVRNKNTGLIDGTVVGSINLLDQELGQSYPLDTVNQTITGAINELANRQSGNVEIIGANRVQVTSTPLPDGSGNKYTIGHINDGLTNTFSYVIPVNAGCLRLYNVDTDQFGHVLKSTLNPNTLHVPLDAAPFDNMVWAWDYAAGRAKWKTLTAQGTYSGDNGITIDGTTIKHTNVGKAASIGSILDAFRMTVDDQGHVAQVSRTNGTTGQYLNNQWQWTTPKNTANSILDGSTPEKLVDAAAIYDIMDGMRLKKLTQVEYDALAIKDPQTVYIIVG